jgi:hypothetical protein
VVRLQREGDVVERGVLPTDVVNEIPAGVSRPKTPSLQSSPRERRGGTGPAERGRGQVATAAGPEAGGDIDWFVRQTGRVEKSGKVGSVSSCSG